MASSSVHIAPKMAGSGADSAAVVLPDLAQPKSIYDMLNFRVSDFFDLSGSLITRLCEGEFGITREEWRFIALLERGPISPSALAAGVGVDRSQGSRSLRRLIDKRLVLREVDRQDGRRVSLRLTDAGTAMYDQIFPKVVAMQQAFLAELDAQEIAVLARCLDKLHRAALAAAESGVVTGQANRRQGGSRTKWVDDHPRSVGFQ